MLSDTPKSLSSSVTQSSLTSSPDAHTVLNPIIKHSSSQGNNLFYVKTESQSLTRLGKVNKIKAILPSPIFDDSLNSLNDFGIPSNASSHYKSTPIAEDHSPISREMSKRPSKQTLLKNISPLRSVGKSLLADQSEIKFPKLKSRASESTRLESTSKSSFPLINYSASTRHNSSLSYQNNEGNQPDVLEYENLMQAPSKRQNFQLPPKMQTLRLPRATQIYSSYQTAEVTHLPRLSGTQIAVIASDEISFGVEKSRELLVNTGEKLTLKGTSNIGVALGNCHSKRMMTSKKQLLQLLEFNNSKTDQEKVPSTRAANKFRSEAKILSRFFNE